MTADRSTSTTGYDREQSPGYLVTLASRLFAGTLREKLTSLDVTPAQVPIILWLHERDGLTQKDLCERACIEQPSVAEMLGRMERAGLVSRTRDPEDGRRFLYHLTPTAREMAAALEADAVAGNRVGMAGLSAAETETFLTLLRRIIDNLRAAQRATAASASKRQEAA